MKTLGDLIASSAEVESKEGIRSYSQAATFKKAFGTVYYSEKVAYYNEEYRILELRITMGSVDDPNDSLHVIRMAFKDVDGKVYNSRRELLDALGYGENSRRQVLHSRASISQTTAREAADMDLYEGIVIPCTKEPTESDSYADYFLPSGRFFYSKTGITLNNVCAVSCSCSSYRYTFAEYNSRDKAHLGPEPERYHYVHEIRDVYRYNKKKGEYEKVGQEDGRVHYRKTNESVLNKGKKSGLCKHLMLFALLLLSGEILKGGVNIAQLRKDIKGMEKARGTSGQFNLGKQERYKNMVGTPENYLKIRELLDKNLKDYVNTREQAMRDAYNDELSRDADADLELTQYGKYVLRKTLEKGGPDFTMDIYDDKSLLDARKNYYNGNSQNYARDVLMKGAFGKIYKKKKK